jgi:O-acetyl-ADP-ribose deacetylase (regulator of RNase III)
MNIQINNVIISLIQDDITHQATDAIVNAANSTLMGGGGVDGAIHRAGGPTILQQCKEIIAKIEKLPPGQAVVISAGNLKSKFVIHTVGPVWYGGSKDKPALLASAYRESLKLADEMGVRSISFPSISTGAYRYPLDQAARIAIETVDEFAKNEAQSLNEVVFVLYDDRTYSAYEKALLSHFTHT